MTRGSQYTQSPRDPWHIDLRQGRGSTPTRPSAQGRGLTSSSDLAVDLDERVPLFSRSIDESVDPGEGPHKQARPFDEAAAHPAAAPCTSQTCAAKRRSRPVGPPASRRVQVTSAAGLSRCRCRRRGTSRIGRRASHFAAEPTPPPRSSWSGREPEASGTKPLQRRPNIRVRRRVRTPARMARSSSGLTEDRVATR